MDRALLGILNGLVEVPGVHGWCWLVQQPWAPLLLAVVALADIGRRRRWWELPAALVGVIAADALCAQALKPLFARPRPCLAIDDILAPFGCGAAFSMPSCHAANAFALAMVLNRPWAFGVALLITLSRAVAGQHYPSDLLAGAVLGLAVGWPLRMVVERLGVRRRAPTGPRPRPGGIA